MTPVGCMLVDEMSGEDDLGAPEMISDPEQNPGKNEKVIQDEMGCDITGGGNNGSIFGKEVDNIADLG